MFFTNKRILRIFTIVIAILTAVSMVAFLFLPLLY